MIETNEMLYNSRGWSQADKKEYKNERNKQMELENTFETELMAMTLKSHILFLFVFAFARLILSILHLMSVPSLFK